VTKRYDQFVAVENVSFSVPRGAVFGLLGPNGAGKTTTIRMIMNITIPDSGKIFILGEPSTEGMSRRIGYLPEERGLYRKMKVLPHLAFLGEIRGLRVPEAKKRAAEWLDRLGLGEWKAKKVEELSKGMQQKIQFIGSILHDPDVIILDEPFSGLDPVNARVLKDLVLEFKERGKTIVLSTHVMEQAEKLCDEIALINRSHLVLEGKVDEIKRRYSGSRLTLRVSGSSDALRGVAGVKSVSADGNVLHVELEPDVSTPDFLRRATPVVEIESAVPYEVSLDDVFVAVVGGDARSEVAA
jgi:ABC-2 type transport system ATP-binding protein